MREECGNFLLYTRCEYGHVRMHLTVGLCLVCVCGNVRSALF
jgi:hypothetical protein